MAKLQVKDLQLDDYIETECTGGIVGDYLPLSGGTVSGNINIDNAILSVNSKIVIGKDNITGDASNYSLLGGISSFCNGSEQIAFGRNCIAGARGYRILAATELSSGIVSLSIDTTSGPISEEIIGLQHSVNITNAATNVGEVLSVNNATSEIFVDKSYRYTSVHSYNEVLSNRTIYFIDKPFIGNINSATGNYSTAEGYYTKALGTASHVEGGYTVTAGTYGHAEGKSTIASWGAHAEGCNTRALNETAHTQNRLTLAEGKQSSASGHGTAALGVNSSSSGYGTIAKDKRSFTWNGAVIEGFNANGGDWASGDDGNRLRLDAEVNKVKNNEKTDLYVSHGDGTFNINPENGLSGFYIGNKNLNDILTELSSAIKD